MRGCIVVACLLIVIGTGTAKSQGMIEKMKTVPSASFVRAFLGHCAQNPGQCERVTKMARAFGTQDLPASMVPLMAPQDQNAQFEGFIVLDGEGAPFLFGVSKGIANGVRMCTCAVANPYANAAEVASTLVEFSGLGRPSLDEATMGQRFRLWSTNGWARGSHISLTDAGPSGLGGVTLGMIAPLAD